MRFELHPRASSATDSSFYHEPAIESERHERADRNLYGDGIGNGSA